MTDSGFDERLVGAAQRAAQTSIDSMSCKIAAVRSQMCKTVCRLLVTATGFDERLVLAAQELASMHHPNAPAAGMSQPVCACACSICSTLECLCMALYCGTVSPQCPSCRSFFGTLCLVVLNEQWPIKLLCPPLWYPNHVAGPLFDKSKEYGGCSSALAIVSPCSRYITMPDCACVCSVCNIPSTGSSKFAVQLTVPQYAGSLVSRRCKDILRQFPTSMGHDISDLQQGTLSANMQLAVRYRLHKKQILHQACPAAQSL